MNIIEKLDACSPAENEFAIVWLGQAGFLFMDPLHHKAAVDPYLSSCGERMKGFVRLFPKMIAAEDFSVDACLITHRHFDHFDYDAIPVIAARNAERGIQFWGSSSAVHSFESSCSKETSMRQLGTQMTWLWPGTGCRAVFADHGELDPEAIGIWLEICGYKVYITGDTAYRPDQMEAVRNSSPDLMLASVNGHFGNLNTAEGAKLAAYTGAKLLIPCHTGMFAEHGGNLELLPQDMEKYAPACHHQFLTAGDVYIAGNDKEKFILKRQEI